MRERHHRHLRERDRLEHQAIARLLRAALRPADCCVDVGASVGDVLAEVVRAAPRGRHIAYEPVPAHAADLAARFPQVDVRARAVGGSGGRLRFRHVLDEPALSSLHELPYHTGHPVAEIVVDVDALDAALPVGFVPRLLKLDAEGAELDILRGAAITLARHRPLVVLEFIRDASGPFCATAAELHDLLTWNGYRIFDVFGTGPLDADALRRVVHARRVQNFVARPD